MLWNIYNCVVSIYLLGAIFNVTVFCSCFQKKVCKSLVENIKLLIVTQTLASLMVVLCSLALAFVQFLPQSFCVLLPTLLVFSLSFAMLNLAVFAIVKYAQLTSKWNLRFGSALVIILTELLVSTAVEFPIIYTAVEGSSIVIYDGAACQDSNEFRATRDMSLALRINVIPYAFFLIFLHFAVLATVIVNRLLLIAVHFASVEGFEDQKQQEKFCKAVQRLIDTLCVVFVGFMIILASFYLENNDESLKFLNSIFNAMRAFSVSILCFPWYLWDEIAMNGQSKGLTIGSSLSEKVGLNRKEDDKMIIA